MTKSDEIILSVILLLAFVTLLGLSILVWSLVWLPVW
jgi:hypothetical protein